MGKMSRYIKRKEQCKVDKSSRFKCAWCGIYLTEYHHMSKHAEGGSNDSDNLILLCPNCHTLAHKGLISENELLNAKKKLSGEVDKSSGYFSVIGIPKLLVGSNEYFNTPNIINYRDENIIRVKIENNNLLISVRIFDKKGYLICWMEDNKWWLANNDILDFTYAKNKLEIKGEDDVYIRFEIDPIINELVVSGNLYFNGNRLIFDKDSMRYYVNGKNISVMEISNSLFENCEYALKF